MVDEQPSKEAAKKKILDKVHNGEVALLHAVSDTNTAILDEILKELKSNGYEFKSLNDLTLKKNNTKSMGPYQNNFHKTYKLYEENL